MPFGESLKRILVNKGKTQKELADLLKVDYAYISRIASDKVPFKPSREFILRIAQKLKCTEAEKNELLKQAGRLDKATEQSAKKAIDRPKLQKLFKSAPKLTEDQLELINKKIEDILSTKRDK